MNNEFYKELFDAAKAQAAKLGVEDFELFFSDGESVSCETFRDEISEFSSSRDGSVSARCVKGGKIGYATTQNVTKEEVCAIIRAAADNASVIEKDDRAIIFGAGAAYREVPKCAYTAPDVAYMKKYVMDCRNALYAADERVSDGSAAYMWASSHFTRLMNSRGLDLSCEGGSVGVGVEAVLEVGGDKEEAGKFEHDCLESLDKTAMAKEAIERAESKFNGGKIASGSYDIVFEDKRVREILDTFLCVFFAERAQKGLSKISKNNVGEKLASDVVTIVDDPFFPGNTMQIAFDGEGVPSKTKNVIENGVLKTMLYNLNSAEKDGVEPTGNASRSGSSIGTKVFSFYIKPGAFTRDELFAKVGNGIFVTEMKGFHAGADAVSGDFSIESEGFEIKDGKLGRRIKSFTVAGNFFDLLKAIEAVGDNLDFSGPGYSRVASPDILVRGLSVAGE